jgi:hypothetical protein
MSPPRPPLAERLRFPASGVVYGLAGAVLLGAACGLARAPFALVAMIGMGAAAFSFWMERQALTAAPGGGRRTNIGLQLTAAYVFLAMVAIGLAGLGDFVVGAIRR